MVKGRTSFQTAGLDLSERARTHGYLVGIFGICFAALVFVLYYISGRNTALVHVVIPTYTVILGTILVCAHRNYKTQSVLMYGMMLMLGVFWLKTFADAWHGHTRPFDIPVILLVPLIFMMGLDFRRLILVAPVQFVAVFTYVNQFGVDHYAREMTSRDQVLFSFVLAAMSAFSVCMFGAIAFARQKTDQRLLALVSEAEDLAATDALTGLKNRRAFMDQLRALWPNRSSICIAFVDLDHFKPLNDQYGHAVGDEVLCKVARCIKDYPNVELSARLGGDEFAIVVETNEGSQTVEQLIAILHGRITQDMRWDSGVISVAASIGYAEGATTKQSLSGLLRAADTAMRRAKGANLGWAKFNPLIDNAAIASSTLEVELRSAIHDGQIKAAVQPIADAKTHDVVAYELLTRWVNSGFERDPSPKDFIPIAEKLGLLNDILWVTLDEALAHIDVSVRRLAINVSPAQLLASDFLDSLKNVLDRHGVSPSAITIEITEEVAFRNVERNVAILEQARAMGIAIALDDFGTGYSSLSMLDTLPLDKIKIDQSFVLKSEQNLHSKSILQAAIRLTRQLGFQCCVEGIETKEAADRVAMLGADHIQGYWLGRPQLVIEQSQKLKLVS